MSYGLIITEEASAVLVEMDEITHELFVLAMLGLQKDPHGLGVLDGSEGAFTTRTLPLGPLGMIAYVVNDALATVTVTDVLWLG